MSWVYFTYISKLFLEASPAGVPGGGWRESTVYKEREREREADDGGQGSRTATCLRVTVVETLLYHTTDIYM